MPRMAIFMTLIALLPLIIAALSIRTFNDLHQREIEERQSDVLERVKREIEKGGGDLQTIITENEVERAGYLYITDSRGNLIHHSRRPVTEAVDLSNVPLVGALYFQGDIKTEGQKRYASHWGELVVGSGALQKLPDGRTVGIFVELPTEEADFVFAQLAERFALLTLLVLVLAGLLSLYLALSIVRPVQKLVGGARRVAEGKLDEPVHVERRDELGELAEEFNYMQSGLKRLKELREEFLFIAAHELRTPVTAIKGFTQMVLEGMGGNVAEEARGYLQKAYASNERLIELINDLLEIARDEAGRLEIEVAPIDIAKPIKEVLDELKPLADEKGIAMVYEPAKLFPSALADATRIKEVMTNLVGNAIKYTVGEGTVTISHEIKEGKLITRVKDTGIGIPKEAQAKLFEKFYRVYNEKTKGIVGTGLGLFIVKQIIEKMGGRIWAESEPDKGSTFSFELPLAK